MRLAAERDRVARQYAENFVDLFEGVVPALKRGIDQDLSVPAAIVHAHLELMARWPDSLISRKCGASVAEQAAARAGAVLAAGPPGSEDYQRALADLDFWLRADHHRRNPGTTADLIAAGLFVLLRDGEIPYPLLFAA
jgi:triphosphoribosyl-dephospho-CoA synthase